MGKESKEDVNKQNQSENFSDLPAAKKLPKSIQETPDNEEKLWSALYEGHASESTDSSVRYAGYAARLRTIMMSAHRYVAYTSDIGESFRPVAHPYIVRSAYGVSWAYILGDVAHEGYKAYLANQRVKFPEKYNDDGTKKRWQIKITDPDQKGQALVVPGQVPLSEDYRVVMAQRGVFQSIASMGLPAFTIHSVVKYSGKALKDAKNKTLRTWGPIGLGLAVVPALPYMFDEPVEHAVEWIFYKGCAAFGSAGPGPGSIKEKEL